MTVTGDFAAIEQLWCYAGRWRKLYGKCDVYTHGAGGSGRARCRSPTTLRRVHRVVNLAGTGEAGGQLVAGPSSISFGNVTIGQTGSQVVTITNMCGQNISVTSVSTSGAGVGVSGISTPFTLAPNQSSTFTVTFSPSSSGSASGAIYLANNSATGSLTIPTKEQGRQPRRPPRAPQVVLSWSPSSSEVIGYNTYRGSVSGGPYAKLTPSPVAQTSYTDQNVTAGDTYYYVVTSVGAGQVESAFSNQAEATVPAP